MLCNVVGTHLEELIQQECKPVGQHLLGDRLRSDIQRERTKNTMPHVDKANNLVGLESFQVHNSEDLLVQVTGKVGINFG